MKILIEKKRDINFELLRILLMLFVIMMHFLGHGKVLQLAKFNTIDYYIYWLFRAMAYPCVNCFVFLSGYYMTKSSLKISKICRLELQVLFYAIVLWIITILVGGRTFAVKDFLYSITPVCSNIYWYVTAYILLLIISPLFNHAIANMTKKMYLLTLAVLIFYTSMLPTFFYWTRNYISKGRDLLWFIVLYLIAGYIKKYNVKWRKRTSILVYSLCCLSMVLSNAVVGNITLILLGNIKAVDILYMNNSPIILIESVALFLFFKEMKVEKLNGNNHVIYISAMSFGAYLFHENIFFREWLWKTVNPSRYIYDNFAIIKTLIFMLITVISIFFMGVILEIFRTKLFKISGITKIEHFIANKIDNQIMTK